MNKNDITAIIRDIKESRIYIIGKYTISLYDASSGLFKVDRIHLKGRTRAGYYKESAVINLLSKL